MPDMKYSTLFKLMSGASIITGLMACQTTSPPTPPPPVTPASAPMSMAESIKGDDAASYSTAVERIFAEGLEFYGKGEYASAIRKFRSPEISRAWPELRVRALKFLAFSYCLTNKIQQCQKAFEDALQIDPKFDLRPSERDHPMWGPIFQQVRSKYANEMANDTNSVSSETPATGASAQEQAAKTASNTNAATSPSENKSEQSKAVVPSDSSTSAGNETVPNR